MIQYYACVRLLLFPQLFSRASVAHPTSTPPSRYLRLCAIACVGLCSSYKRVHDLSPSICYSPIATQNLMLAGLALIYALSRCPNAVPARSARDGVTSCSIMLYVITERWPAASRYCRAFETVRNAVFERVMEEGDGASPDDAGVHVETSMDTNETREALGYVSQEFGAGRGIGICNIISNLGLSDGHHQTYGEGVEAGTTDPTLAHFLLPGMELDDDLIMSADWHSLVPSA